MAIADLQKARRALGQGRADEALLFLWNAVEPARLDGSGALRELEQLAAAVGERGDESQKREVARLLATVRGTPADPAPVEVEEEKWTPPTEPAEQPAAGEPQTREAEEETEPAVETPPRRSIARYLLPLFVLFVILVNVITRVFGGD